MNVTRTKLEGVLVVEPKVWRDDRGYFVELWQGARYGGSGMPSSFAQDNLSFSTRGVLRGLHFQNPSTQGKLVFPLMGDLWDVVVDLRRSSRTFGQWIGVPMWGEKKKQIWGPAGFGQGFGGRGETGRAVYKYTDKYDANVEWG